MNGKWFLLRLQGSSEIGGLKSYYLINNSAIKRFILYGGCNVQFSTYSLSDNKITFGAVGSTRKACSPDNDSSITDPLFLRSTYIQLDGKSLVFYDANLKETIAFTSIVPL